MPNASNPATVASLGVASESATARGWLGGRVRFDRNELSGAFGDIGTDFPLLVGMILAAKLDVASVLTLFGLMQILTGLVYGMPMPAQPLKAMAVLVITQKLSGGLLAGGGLAIGLAMLVLTVTGLINWLARAIPKSVVRGIQLGLGLQLSSLALKDYIPGDGASGYVLAGLAFVITVALLGNRRLPPAPLLILLGFVYAAAFHLNGARLEGAFNLHLPHFRVPSAAELLTGAVLLALPQIPLSLGNSILATRQVTADLFPERLMSVRKIGFTYSLMNLVNPFFGDLPRFRRDRRPLRLRGAHRGVCHSLRVLVSGAWAIFCWRL
jgi:xanthine/uracil/vitamin C permease (AzgA family)